MLVVAAIAGLGTYLALAVAARFAYPRMLFPAPELRVAPLLPQGAERVALPHPDGSHTDVLWFAAPTGARTVVIFHGNGESIYDELAYAEELRRRGFGVLLVEYRGYGTTYGPPPSEAAIYDDGEAALAWLGKKDVPRDRIALWGWSLGSGVAAEMAARGHGARLVLLSPFTSIVAMGQRLAPILPVSLLMSHRFDTLGKASRIKQPSLVVHGDADELIPIAMGETVAKALPDARLLRVTGGHHVDLLEPGAPITPTADQVWTEIAAHLAR